MSKLKKSDKHTHDMTQIEGGHVDDRVGMVPGPDSVNRRVSGPGPVPGLARLKWAICKRGFSDCLTDISLWMKSSKLNLKSDKTEFIIIGTKQQRHKLSNHFPVKLLDNDICPSDSVRNLGVVFDSDFSFHKHVSNICKSCFYHIRDLRRIWRHIPLSTAKTI